MNERLFEPDLDVGTHFSRAWEVYKDHFWPTVAVFVLFSLLTGGAPAFDEDAGIGDLIMFVISGPIAAGTYLFALRLVRGDDPDVGDMFRGFQAFGKAFAVWTLYAVMVVVGLVLLVIPGIYAAVAFMPAMYLVLDDDLGVIDTLRKAWDMTAGHRGSIFLVLLAIVVINLIGLMALLIGVIFTGALSLLIGASLYEELATSYEPSVSFESAS